MIGQVEGNAIVLDIGGGRYLVFEHTTLTRGGRKSTPPTADLRRGDLIHADR